MTTKMSKLHKSFEKLNKVREEIKNNFVSCAEDLGIELKFRVIQEYDDNNYYDDITITSFGSLNSIEVKGYNLDDYEGVINFIKELEPSNAVDFITDGKCTLASIVESRNEDIENFISDADCGYDAASLIVECIKKGHSIEKIDSEIIPFLSEVTQSNKMFLPESWEE